MRRKLGGGPLLDDAPFVDYADAVSELGGLRKVMGDEQRGNLDLPQYLGQLPPGACAGAGVQRGQRLVEQQRGRPARKRPSERHALALAAGKRAGSGVGQPSDAEALEQLGRPPATVAPAQLASGNATFSALRCGNSAYSWNR